MLQQQLEATKLEEMDTSQTIQTVEQAEIPEGKAFPSRGKILVIVTVVGLFFSVLLAFVREYFEKARLDPVEGEKLAAIRGMLGWGKGERRG
jgi:uncharacterized protein involved in exopolysaccharide biosynthesis